MSIIICIILRAVAFVSLVSAERSLSSWQNSQSTPSPPLRRCMGWISWSAGVP